MVLTPLRKEMYQEVWTVLQKLVDEFVYQFVALEKIHTVLV